VTVVPELPEVETIRRGLAPALTGATITDAEVLDPRFTRPAAPAEVAGSLQGQRIDRVGRAGKYLIWELSDEAFLLIHLRMTGTLLLDPPSDPPHTRARFELDTGHRLAYVDPRRFGTGHLVRGQLALEAYLGDRLGPEPLTPAFTVPGLRSAGRGRTAPIKAFLLDQRRLAGVGNIYADEALFRAGIHPLRQAGRLTGPQWAALHAGVEAALQAGIDAKGASIDDFRHVDGARGTFQDRFLIHLREGEPCLRCGTPVRKLVVGGRGTYVCERCQPRPRRRAGAGGATPLRRAAR
jgi:formamidopyrimidine-DNA glycosylase